MAEDPEAPLGSQPAAAAGRIVSVDIVRGFAILWVILYHLWSDLRYPHITSTGDTLRAVLDRTQDGDPIALLGALADAFFRVGFLGVPLFMILSGLSLTLSAMSRPVAPRATPVWLFRRLRRVMVPYWFGFAYTIAVVLVISLVLWQKHSGHSYLWFVQHGDIPLTKEQLFAGGLMIPRAWKNEWIYAPEGSLWFVLLIVQYYLLFPLLLPLLRRVGPVLFVSAALALALVAQDRVLAADGNLTQADSWVHTLAPFRIYEFAVGMAGGYVMMTRRESLRRNLRDPFDTVGVMVLGVAAFVAGNLIDSYGGNPVTLQGPLIAFGMSAFFLPLIVKTPGRVEVTAPAKFLAWVGVISYTVLIVNEPLRSVTHQLRLENARIGWYVLWVGVLYMPITFLAARPLAVFLGLVERQPGSRHSAPAPAVATDRVAT